MFMDYHFTKEPAIAEEVKRVPVNLLGKGEKLENLGIVCSVLEIVFEHIESCGAISKEKSKCLESANRITVHAIWIRDTAYKVFRIIGLDITKAPQIACFMVV